MLLLLFIVTNTRAQDLYIDKSGLCYQIAPVYNYKLGIVSLTFDDGSPNQFTIGIQSLKERNLPASFYLITDLIDSVTENILNTVFDSNYEIGSHTVKHRDLVNISAIDAQLELLNSQAFLNEHFGVNSGLTLSYPWGNYNSSVKKLAKEIYIAARSTRVGYNSIYSLDRYALRMQCFDKKTGLGNANSWVDYAIRNKKWLIEMIHGIDGIGFSPVDHQVLTDHLDYIKKLEDKLWCTSVSNVIKYIDESAKAKIYSLSSNDSVFVIKIDDNLDDSIYNQPLTFRVKVPDSWDGIKISNGETIRSEVINGSKFFLFNALPDNTLLTIKPAFIDETKNEPETRLVYLSENPFTDHINLTVEVFHPENLEIILSDLSGKIMVHQRISSDKGLVNFFFNTSNLGRGVYIIKVFSNNGNLMQKKINKI